MPSFEWNIAKARANFAKHRVYFEDAVTAFSDPLSLDIPDPAHSSPLDERFVMMGRSGDGQLLVVVHSDVDELVRIISARLATRRERVVYEEGAT